MRLVISSVDFDRLRDRLFAVAPAEAAAFLAAEPSGDRLLIRSFHVFEPDECEGNAHGNVVVAEDAQIRELARMKRAGHAAVEVHTHPRSGRNVGFSPYDDDEMPAFARYVQNKLPGRPFAALVLGEAGYAARGWSVDRSLAEVTLDVIGEATAVPEWLSEPQSPRADTQTFDRQIRALGVRGQAQIAQLRVGVVGLGGTGSQVVQQLAHIGVRDYVLVEDDRIETSNLPRLAGATRRDVWLRRTKTAIARRTISRLTRSPSIHRTGTLRCHRSLDALAKVDLIIGCVDNDGARMILTELAAAHLVPYLDLGVGIEAAAGRRYEIGGRVSFYLPGGPCLACADEIDFAEAAQDLETEAARKMRVERGYARDRTVEAALMPLNTVIVGLAMMELLAFATATRPVIPFMRHDANAAKTVAINVSADSDCPLCGPAYAMADRHQIQRYALD